MALAGGDNRKFDLDPLLQAELVDARSALNRFEFDNKLAFIKYIHSKLYDELFFILGNAGQLYAGQVVDNKGNFLKGDVLFTLYERYKRHFIDPVNFKNTVAYGQVDQQYFDVWMEIFELLVYPISGIHEGLPYKEVLFQTKIFDSAINLGMIYDLSFRFAGKTENVPLYFSHVTDNTIVEYLDRLTHLAPPVANKMIYLDGNRKLSDVANQSGSVTPDQVKRIKVRENLLERASIHLRAAGGITQNLTSITDFAELFSTRNSQNTILLSAHFHDGRVHTAIDNKTIRLVDLLELIEELKKKGSFRSDLIIDAATCNNYCDFRELYNAGINYIHFSHNNLSYDLSVYTLVEMFEGHLAKNLNWKYPYLDGETHLHIIYAKIHRAYFITMNFNNVIKLPNYMDKIITVQGDNIMSFLDYIEDLQKEENKQGKALDFTFNPYYNKGLDEEQSADLIQLILGGAATVIGQLIGNYILRGANNKATIEVMGENGTKIKAELCNRTDAEIEELLSQKGVVIHLNKPS